MKIFLILVSIIVVSLCWGEVPPADLTSPLEKEASTSMVLLNESNLISNGITIGSYPYKIYPESGSILYWSEAKMFTPITVCAKLQTDTLPFPHVFLDKIEEIDLLVQRSEDDHQIHGAFELPRSIFCKYSYHRYSLKFDIQVPDRGSIKIEVGASYLDPSNKNIPRPHPYEGQFIGSSAAINCSKLNKEHVCTIDIDKIDFAGHGKIADDGRTILLVPNHMDVTYFTSNITEDLRKGVKFKLLYKSKL